MVSCPKWKRAHQRLLGESKKVANVIQGYANQLDFLVSSMNLTFSSYKRTLLVDSVMSPIKSCKLVKDNR